MVRQPGDSLIAADEGSLAERVGRRLRERRKSLGRTLADVAATATVSVSYLSAVENGTNQPSLPVLARIVHALDLTIADVLRAEGQNRMRRGMVDGEPGETTLSHPGLQLSVVTAMSDPGEAGDCPVAYGADDVFVYVLAGGLAVTVDGAEYELRTGDSLDARAPRSVAWRATGSPVTTAIWTSTRTHADAAGI